MILNDIAYCSIYLKRPKSLPSGSHLSNSHAPAYEYGICSPSQRIYACHFGEYLPISCISPPIYAADFSTKERKRQPGRLPLRRAFLTTTFRKNFPLCALCIPSINPFLDSIQKARPKGQARYSFADSGNRSVIVFNIRGIWFSSDSGKLYSIFI